MVYRMVAASAPVLLLLLLSLSVASTGSEPSPSSADREERKSSDIHSISQDLEVLRKALLENDPSLLYGKKETDTEAETGKKCSASSHPARPRAAMMTARQEGISAATELLQKECHLSAEEAEMVKRDIDEAFAHERGTADPNAPPVFGFGRIAFRLLYQALLDKWRSGKHYLSGSAELALTSEQVKQAHLIKDKVAEAIFGSDFLKMPSEPQPTSPEPTVKSEL